MPTPPPSAGPSTHASAAPAPAISPQGWAPVDAASVDSAPTGTAVGMPVDPAAPGSPTPTSLTVRYFAGARAAANGVSAEPAEANSLDELTQLLADRHGERLAVVLKAASFLVDGLACHNRSAPLPADATVDVLPPFAGG